MKLWTRKKLPIGIDDFRKLIQDVNPVLLIDEYDTPMMSAYEYNYYEDVRSFFYCALWFCS